LEGKGRDFFNGPAPADFQQWGVANGQLNPMR
jgi:hypothetical protein